MDTLLAQWLSLVPDVDAGRELLTRWSEPQRKYHDREHLLAMLSIVDEYAATASDPDAVQLAAWFHDAVYDPTRPDNESASAELARHMLSGRDDLDEIVRLVLLTASHDPEPADTNGALLCDADLAVLAGSPEQYRAYREAIRAEYIHVPDDAFRVGRTAVLRHLLALPALYHVPVLAEKFEARARVNISAELDLLAESK